MSGRKGSGRKLRNLEGATREMLDICRDRASSDWLKDAISALLQRDALDAAGDAETLARVFGARLAELLPAVRCIHCGEADNRKGAHGLGRCTQMPYRA